MQKIVAKSKLIVKESQEAEEKAQADLQIPDPSRSVAKAILEEALEQGNDEKQKDQ